MRSKKDIEKAPHRALLRATGVTEADMGKPFIAIVNSYVDIVPGHVHLQEFRKARERGCARGREVSRSSSIPSAWMTASPWDTPGMKFSLPSRELIADCVETMMQAHQFDGMVCMPNCDKIVPGMLNAAMRVNIPAIFISGGPMAGRAHTGRRERLT